MNAGRFSLFSYIRLSHAFLSHSLPPLSCCFPRVCPASSSRFAPTLRRRVDAARSYGSLRSVIWPAAIALSAQSNDNSPFSYILTRPLIPSSPCAFSSLVSILSRTLYDEEEKRKETERKPMTRKIYRAELPLSRAALSYLYICREGDNLFFFFIRADFNVTGELELTRFYDRRAALRRNRF